MNFEVKKFPKAMGVIKLYILAVLSFAIIVICHAKPPVPEDIGTNFFLKASKSVPRIGRRNMEYDNYFLKASKSIPRIGRRTLTSSGANGNGGWMFKDLQDPMKRSFFEKYFKETEPPVWSDLEKVYKDYPDGYPEDEFYPGAGIKPKPDPYWPRVKKDEEVAEEQPQN